MHLRIDRLSFTYPDASTALFDGFSSTFAQGWTGLIGDNGCGKTTLAKLTAGLLKPDSGTISPKLFSAYCPQDSSGEPSGIFDFACDRAGRAMKLKRTLQIEDDWLWRFSQLSGGQQKRIQIACCLWTEPDLLVMDEPTNDLDIESRALVGKALATYTGIGLLISHDRNLLDALVGQCLVFEQDAVVMRPGGYTKAFALARDEAASALRERRQAKREVSRIREESVRRTEEARRSKGRLSLRTADRHDASLRDKIGRARVTSKDGVAGRAASSLSTRLKAAQAQLSATSVPKRYEYQFQMVGAPAPSKTVCHLQGSAIGQGDFSLAIPELWVGPTDHIGIVGHNGSGKSTLVRHMLGHVSDGIRVAYVPQEVDHQMRESVLLRFLDRGQKERGEVLSHVARLNSDPVRMMDGKETSPGEMRKLLLVDALLEEPNILILDEPTNHLDVTSIQALQALLSSFAGAVVLVSHDAALIQESCKELWCLEEEGPERFCLTRTHGSDPRDPFSDLVDRVLAG